MTRLEMMENTEQSISIMGKIGRYFLHGFALGILTFTLLIFCYLFPLIVYPPIFFFGLSFTSALFYGLLFIFLGGINQTMAERFWNIESETNIGTGMRDGFIVYVVFNIAYSPMTLALSSFSAPWAWQVISPLMAFILLLLSTPIYILLLGLIGKSIAVLIYVDKEPEMPADYQERIQKCPFCGTSYYYSIDSSSKGKIECQNCAKLFAVG